MLVRGQAVGERIAVGRVRVVRDVSAIQSVQGEILLAKTTDPDSEPVMRRVAGIVTDTGARTGIVYREFGEPCNYPEFAECLVREGIDSISLNPDVAIATAIRVAEAEGGATTALAT